MQIILLDHIKYLNLQTFREDIKHKEKYLSPSFLGKLKGIRWTNHVKKNTKYSCKIYIILALKKQRGVPKFSPLMLLY